MTRRSLRTALAIGLTLASPAALAQAPEPQAAQPVAASPELQARIDALPAILAGAGDYDSYFAPAFRAQVPAAQFSAMSRQLGITGDAPARVESVEIATPHRAVVTLAISAGVVTMGIAVDPAEPHQVTGLRVTGFNAREATLDAVAAAIEGLHGNTGHAWARLGDGPPQILRSDDAEQPFGVGSAFKLWILAELVRATNAGERSWDDMVTLGSEPRPGGAYFIRPTGSQVSLRELAEAMISVSDNSATDILLDHLGREAVEAMLPVVGVAPEHVALNRPLPGTLEFFKLKGVDGGALGRRWIASDEAGRRALLAGDVAETPIGAIDPMLFRDGKPMMIDRIEFFASPADLVRTMDWLRRNTADNPVARAILSKNAGITPTAAGRWRFVGYKGGSEPGVMSMTLLLGAESGDWYVFTASWNDPEAAVDEARFAALVSRWAELAAD